MLRLDMKALPLKLHQRYLQNGGGANKLLFLLFSFYVVIGGARLRGAAGRKNFHLREEDP